MKQITEVIVNGAGPVGLFCAYMLLKQGHSVYLLDKKAGPTDQSRAFGITPRSMEILQHQGIAYRILQHALSIRGARLFINGTNMGTFYLDELDTVFPQLTSLPQSKVEAIIVEEIEKIQGKIHWNTTLIDYEQQEEGVTARVKDILTDEIKEISAKYIVGADGCHSAVRKQDSTWTYDGQAIKSRFALADLILEGPDVDLIRNRQILFYHSKGSCILIPMRHDGDDDKATLRLVANLGPYENDDGPRVNHGINTREVLTEDKVKEILKDRTEGLRVTMHSSIWLTYFNINERIANGFRRNRAFLIGDAAHCHSPAGGQGMNIGLQDAENLAWKLSMVLKGEASDPEKVLDSYTIEREPMVKAVMTTAGSLTRMVFSQTYFMSLLRYLIISAVFNITFLRRSIVTRLMQVDFKLGESPILLSSNTKQQQVLLPPGSMLKDTRALLSKDVTTQLERQTIYQILEKFNSNNQHTLLWMITRQTWQREPKEELTQSFIKRITEYNSCRGLVVQSITQYSSYIDENQTKKTTDKVDFWVDTHAIAAEDSLSNKIGFTKYLKASKDEIPPAALVVIRPDRYVAYSGLISTLDELEHAFTFLNRYCLSKKQK
ncbi:FAD binding domain-containing protein [Halteromyces radiatus]|uniref:FAD binding domain-containing protein n=1 Tax=Halteromyces radiatus TaxID=101107 RepID=UPI002220F3CC|nr:FAD binding domain-containing protein [Halteromyces radiatus]KAI8096479.1 FAD binding domain-containing protein [Halteromyces radiatus]